MFTRSVAVLVLIGLLLACGGGSPSAPSGNQVFVDIGVSSLSRGGVLEAALSFDGTEIERVDWSALAGGCGGNCQVVGTLTGVRSGRHTAALTIVRQSRPAVIYAVLGFVVVTDLSNGSQRTIGLPRRDVTLRAGEQVSYTIDL